MSNEVNDDTAANAVFIGAFMCIQKEVNRTAHEKGWYENDEAIAKVEMPKSLRDYIRKCQNGTRVALIHSEISEGLEADRKDLADDKIPQFTGMEAELADAIIRIMDFAEENKLRIAQALIAKAEFNKTRSYRHGGKAF